MRIGTMDRRIAIQQMSETRSATGYTTASWSTIMRAYAEVTQSSGREFQEADKVNADVLTVFRIRYRRGLSNKMRIVYDNRNFDILEIKEIGRREFLSIAAKAEVL